MVRRALDALFVILALAAASLTLAATALDGTGLVPAWLQVDKESSNLEVRAYARRPELSLASLADGSYQDGFEDWLNDSIPRRDDAMMLNGTWQRLPISLAAAALGYEVYPTFYGSDLVYWPERESAIASSKSADAETTERLARVARDISSLAAEYPGTSFYAYRVDMLEGSSMNPTASLMPDAMDTEWFTENFYGLLEGVDVIDTGLYGDYGTGDESIYEDFFRTDHHWHGTTAYRAYAACLERMLGSAEDPAKIISEYVVEVPFYGTGSRLGRCDAVDPDYIRDYEVNLSGLRVWVDDNTGWREVGTDALVSTDRYRAGDVDTDRYLLRYEDYFHGNYQLLRVENPGAAHPERTLLMVVDSYSNPMERFFAQNYGTVIAWDPRGSTRTLRSLMEEWQPDDVLMMCCATALNYDTVLAVLEGPAS